MFRVQREQHMFAIVVRITTALKVVSVLAPVFLGLSGEAPIARAAQPSGAFIPTGSLLTARSGHTATLLQNGKVLIAGGNAAGFLPGFVATAEVYDAASGTFTETGDMNTARSRHTATLLADGRVLIAGGFTSPKESPSRTVEIYDPSSGTFTPAGEVGGTARQAHHGAVLLNNGRVLIAGIGSRAVLYNPATASFEDAGEYADPAPWLVQTATLLTDGSVLLTGCADMCGRSAAQVYDPKTNTFSATGPMKRFYNVNTATLLPDGKVLIEGSDEYSEPADAEIYDPASGTFTTLPNAAAPHEFSTATLLAEGIVLIAGSQMPGGSADASAELFDASTGAFIFAGNMTTRRHSHTATLLTGGSVLIAGGNRTWPAPTADAELYRPAILPPSPTLLSVSPNGEGAILHANTRRPVSAQEPAAAGEAIEIYATGIGSGGVIAPRIFIGGSVAEVLWFGDAPACSGLNRINVRVPSDVSATPAVPVRMMYLERPSNQVTIAVQ